jgi:hypothetical protein
MATVDMGGLGDPVARQREEEKSAEVITGGSMVEAVCGVAAVVLAILGLAGLMPIHLVAVATIALGAALVFEGGAIAARYSKLLGETVGSRQVTAAEFGGGMTAELLGGLAGIVLGILALLNVYPLELTAVAAIVFGGALLVGSGSTGRLNALVIEGWYDLHDTARRVAREAVSAAAGAQVLAGLAGAILGILALVGTNTLTLTLVALLCLGASGLLSGAAVSSKMLSMLRR